MKIWSALAVVMAAMWLVVAAPSNVRAVYAQSQDNVYSWSEVPQSQHIPITRALFDRGGYQLYDQEGEIIAIPFTSNSLSVMKFKRSRTGDMYMVNRGDYPVLYVPENGYLENATVSGAYWYPFAHGYNPPHPVYMSFAPSFADYDSMGWYPGMACYGGYYSNDYIGAGAVFGLAVGLSFLIGGHNYNGWQPYYSYWHGHPTNYRTGWHNRQVYGWAGRPGGGRVFGGGGHQFGGGGHQFGGGQHQFGGGNNHPLFGGGNNHPQFGGGGNNHPLFSGGGNNHPHFSGGGNSHPLFSGGGGGNNHPQFSGGGGSHNFGGGNSGSHNSSGGGNKGGGNKGGDNHDHNH